MTTFRRQTASFSSANLGFVSCACGLVGVIFPPLIVVALPTAHVAWWTWLSGREERGFGWAMAGMVMANSAFALWAVLLAEIFVGSLGVQFVLIYLIVFFSAVGVTMKSAAAKYVAVGTLLTTVALSLVFCHAHQQREAARSTHCLFNIRKLGLAAQTVDRHPQQDGYAWLERVLPYLEDESRFEGASSEIDSTQDAFRSDGVAP